MRKCLRCDWVVTSPPPLFSDAFLADIDVVIVSFRLCWGGNLSMKTIGNQPPKKYRAIIQGRCALILLLFFGLGGCSLWNGYVDPNYGSSRADRLCHPYGQCSQGSWVAIEGAARDPLVVQAECEKGVDQRYGKDWWENSVARGLEIGTCMEQQGFILRQ